MAAARYESDRAEEKLLWDATIWNTTCAWATAFTNHKTGNLSTISR